MNTFNLLKEGKKEFCDLNNDYILPEYIPDVNKIAGSDVNCIITNQYVNGSNLTLDGEVCYNILLICDDGHIRNIIYTEDFSINYTSNDENDNLHQKCIVESSNIKLVSPRKISCKAKISLATKEQITLSSEARLICDDSALAKATVEYKYTEKEYMKIFDKCITLQHASQDIELPSNKEEIENIVFCKLNTVITEQKHIDNKLYLKGETFLDLLYESVNGAYIKVDQKFPFSDIIDDIDDSLGYMCEVRIRDIKAVASNNSFGEMRLLELDYTYDIYCTGYNNQKYLFAEDLYSTEYDCDYDYSVAPIYKLNNIFSGNISINDTLNCDEISENSFDNIITCSASTNNCEVKISADRIILSGNVRYDLVVQGDRLYHFAHTIPFKYEKECDYAFEELFEEHKVYSVQCNAELNNGKVIIGSELYFTVMVAEIKESRYIESAKLTRCGNDNNTPMILYYPQKQECLWDVAKKFKCTCNDIINTNSLKNDDLSTVKVLLLPRKKPKTIFNRII